MHSDWKFEAPLFQWFFIGSISRLYNLCIISYLWLLRTLGAHKPPKLHACSRSCSFAAGLICPRESSKRPSVQLQLASGLVRKLANSNNSCNLAHKVTSLFSCSCRPHILLSSLRYNYNRLASKIAPELVVHTCPFLDHENSAHITPT